MHQKRFTPKAKPVDKPHFLALPLDKSVCIHMEITDEGVKRCQNPATKQGRHGWTCSAHARNDQIVKPQEGTHLIWEPEDAAALESMSAHSFLYYGRNRHRVDRFKARFLDKVDDAELRAMIAKSQGHSLRLH